MNIRPYTSDDKQMLDELYLSRDMTPLPTEFLPKHGVIVPGVAAGFLYLAEAGLCFIEGYISNRYCSQYERSLALDAITEALAEKAKELGVKKLMALTQSQAIYERSLKLKFADMGSYQVTRLDIVQE